MSKVRATPVKARAPLRKFSGSLTLSSRADRSVLQRAFHILQIRCEGRRGASPRGRRHGTRKPVSGDLVPCSLPPRSEHRVPAAFPNIPWRTAAECRRVQAFARNAAAPLPLSPGRGRAVATGARRLACAGAARAPARLQPASSRRARSPETPKNLLCFGAFRRTKGSPACDPGRSRGRPSPPGPSPPGPFPPGPFPPGPSPPGPFPPGARKPQRQGGRDPRCASTRRIRTESTRGIRARSRVRRAQLGAAAAEESRPLLGKLPRRKGQACSAREK